MKKRYLFSIVFLLLFYVSANAQQTASSGSRINFYYPIGKKNIDYTIFINKQMVSPIVYGDRISIPYSGEGSSNIVIIQGTTYAEPRSLSKNARTITLKQGATYYFRINSDGSLDYSISEKKGKEEFEKDKDFRNNIKVLQTIVSL